jgi:hypothetical protein
MRIPASVLIAAVVIGFAVTVYIYLQGPKGVPYYSEGNFTFANTGYSATSYYGKLIISANQTANVTIYPAGAVFVIPAGAFKSGMVYQASVQYPGWSGAVNIYLYYDTTAGSGIITWDKSPYVSWKAVLVNLTNYYLFYPAAFRSGDKIVCPSGISSVYAVTGISLSYEPSSTYNPVVYVTYIQTSCGSAVSAGTIASNKLSYVAYSRVSPTQSMQYTSQLTTITLSGGTYFFVEPYLIVAGQSNQPTAVTIKLS